MEKKGGKNGRGKVGVGWRGRRKEERKSHLK